MLLFNRIEIGVLHLTIEKTSSIFYPARKSLECVKGCSSSQKVGAEFPYYTRSCAAASVKWKCI